MTWRRLSSGGSHSHEEGFPPWDQRAYPCEKSAYAIRKDLGKGATAQVCQAHCGSLDTEVALKIVSLNVPPESQALLRQEAETMHHLRHPNLLPVFCSFTEAACISRTQPQAAHAETDVAPAAGSFQPEASGSGGSAAAEPGCLHLVLPYVSGGSLDRILHTHFHSGMDEPLLAAVARDVLQALAFLHHHELMHRDLKAANLLVHDDGRILLADFGVAAALKYDDVIMEESAPHQHQEEHHRRIKLFQRHQKVASLPPTHPARQLQKRTTFAGTPCYMAPEVLEQLDGYGPPADIWSFGILMLELALGKAPRSDRSLTAVILSTIHDESPELMGDGFSQDAKDFVAACLKKDPAARLTADDLLNHPFLQAAKSCDYLCRRLLGQKPAHRTSSSGGSRRSLFRRGNSGSKGPPSAASSPSSSLTQKMETPDSNDASNRATHGSEDIATASGLSIARASTASSMSDEGMHPATGREHVMTYTISAWFRRAEVAIDNLPVLIKRHSFWEQVRFRGDKHQFLVSIDALDDLLGATVSIDVQNTPQAEGKLKGSAVVDDVQLPEPAYSVLPEDSQSHSQPPRHKFSMLHRRRASKDQGRSVGGSPMTSLTGVPEWLKQADATDDLLMKTAEHLGIDSNDAVTSDELFLSKMSLH
ncbi:hypothetical protein WJX73_005502 [Symbiochloris irregularis]|uniref:Protein kinase domain-containing protein n=1 Tax=Symbiochloris irregularis TaxID=706552 RepID=A0AAW1PZ64_9CHLO